MMIGENHSIGWHPCFAFLWIAEGGMLTVQFGWLLAEITYATPASMTGGNDENKQIDVDQG
jgi:hypothetical protein